MQVVRSCTAIKMNGRQYSICSFLFAFDAFSSCIPYPVFPRDKACLVSTKDLSVGNYYRLLLILFAVSVFLFPVFGSQLLPVFRILFFPETRHALSLQKTHRLEITTAFDCFCSLFLFPHFFLYSVFGIR